MLSTSWIVGVLETYANSKQCRLVAAIHDKAIALDALHRRLSPRMLLSMDIDAQY